MARHPHADSPDLTEPEGDDEAFEHILTCVVCGQSFDMRDGTQLEHHEQEIHKPLPRN